MKLTHASTFSGIGAPEIAAEMLGWDNLFHVEINPFGRQILEYYFPNSKSYEDITKSDFREWRGKVDVLTGGFPCQPFSYAGKRRGSEDDRYLWPFMLKCIEQVQPRWFVGENVGGITTMVFPGEDVEVGEQASLFGEGDKIYEKRERYVIDEICGSLERAGYSVQPMLIPACAVGAPHRRDRVFIVASRNNDKGEQMARTATDANGGDNGRGRPTGRESEGEEKRISQRDEARKSEQSAMLRHVLERDTANTNSHRRCEIYEYVQSELADGAEPFGNGREWTSSYTYCIGQSASRLQDRCERQTLDGKCESESFNGIGRPRSERPSSDTESEQGDGLRLEQRESCKPQSCQFGGGDCKGSDLLPENRWRTFPSVSPVCRRHDGFSSDVVRYLTDDVYDAIQEHCTDQDLREAFSKEEVRQSVGRLYKIPEPQVLLQILLSKEELRQSRQEQGCLSVRSEEVSQGILRKLRKQRPCADSPQGLQLQEQLSRELGISVPTLSHDVALAAVAVSTEVESMRSYVRRESLKAYGNAIVPQVMYEIFRGIDEIESNNRNIQTFKK